MIFLPDVCKIRQRAPIARRHANAGAGGNRDTTQNRFQIEIVPADGTSATN
jgi:hypothetical protein